MGTGGGIVIIFALNYLFKPKKEENDNQQKDVFKYNIIVTLMSIIPMSIVSAVIYIANGNVDYKMLAVYLPGAFVGGLIGAFLMDKLKTKVIRNIFAGMVIYAGIRMIFK